MPCVIKVALRHASYREHQRRELTMSKADGTAPTAASQPRQTEDRPDLTPSAPVSAIWHRATQAQFTELQASPDTADAEAHTRRQQLLRCGQNVPTQQDRRTNSRRLALPRALGFWLRGAARTAWRLFLSALGGIRTCGTAWRGQRCICTEVPPSGTWMHILCPPAVLRTGLCRAAPAVCPR
jgi:hypothetical protein